MKKPSAIILILLTTFAGCLSPSASRDLLPSPDHVVPQVRTQPKIDGAISPDEWDDAIRLDSSFIISDGSFGAGTYPFSLWIGADEKALYIAVEIREIGPNPFAQPNGRRFPDTLDLYFAGPSGPLVAPSDNVALHHTENWGWAFDDGYWTGSAWRLQEELHTSTEKDGYPKSGRYGAAGNTGDALVYEFYLERQSPLHAVDGLHLDGPTDFRMCVQFVRQDSGRSDGGTGGPYEWAWDAHSDTFPGDGPTRDTQNNTATWLRLRTAI